MKSTALLSLLAFVSPLCAAPIDDAAALLQSSKFPEAAAAFAALPAAAGEPGQAAYLKALSLHLAGRQDEAITAAGAVPADSPWELKARFLTGAALTKAKQHQAAEAIYAAAAARAFSPQRRDALVKALLDFADEAVTPVAAGEVTPPQPDWKKAAALCEKVLDMPITAELRAEVLFRKAMLYHQAGIHQAAADTFNAWLLACDPEWSLPLGPHRKNTSAKLTGKPRTEARLYLAEHLLALRRTGDARAVTVELLAMLTALPAASADQALAGDAAWLQVRTYAPLPPVREPQRQQTGNNQPNQALQRQQAAQGENDPFDNSWLPAQGEVDPFATPAQQAARRETGPINNPSRQFANQVPFPSRGPNPAYDAADHLAQLRAFLTNHPAHPAAPLAAEAIAHTLDRDGKDAEAIAAWSDFIEAKAFKFDANAAANRKQDTSSGLTPAEALARRQQAAAFRIGQLHSKQRRYAEAIAQWQQYITAWPNGAEWQQAQSGIVDAEFLTGLTAVAAGDETKAREVFDAFLSRYPLDARARQILFIFGQTRYAAAQQLKEAKAAADLTAAEFQQAIDAWARLIAKYPATEEASLALYNTALILSEEFGRLEDGLAAFKRVTWGKWAEPAKRRVELLNSKSLAVASERAFRLTETPAVKVSVRNIEKLKVSRYPLDVEAFFRSRHRMDAIDLLDIDLIAPEQTWEVPVANYARFRSIQQEIPIEFAAGKAGACIVRVDGDDWQATTLVVRSDIEVLVESARREVLAYVMNGSDKKPLAAANVLVSDGEKIIATGLTGTDGVFRAKPEGIEKARSVRVLVSTPQGMAGSFLSLEGMSVSTVPEKMARVFFDRGSYAPGEQVGWHAIRRDVKDGTFQVPVPGEGWKWRAQLPNGRLLYEGPVTWSPQGLCSGEFTLPAAASDSLDGDYRVRVFNDKESLQANFTVEVAGGVPRGRIDATTPTNQAYLRGDTITGAFTVSWSNGLPVSGERGMLTLPDGTTKDVLTDSAGRVAYEFAAAAMKPGSYAITLAVPAAEVMHALALRIVEFEYTARFERLPELALAGEPCDLKVKAVGYRGEDFATPLRLTILRREPAKSGRVLEGVPWISGFTNQPNDTLLAEHALQTAASGETTQSVTLPQPGIYLLKLSGKDRQGRDITAETTLRAVGGDADSKLRLLADPADLVVGQALKLRVQSGSAHPFALVTVHAQEFFSHQLVALQAGANTLEIPTAAAYTPNFRVTVAALDGRQVHLASRPFELRGGLKVSLTATGPGAADYTVQTTDLSGQPVAATVFTRAWDLTDDASFKPAGRVVIPARSTGLSLESSVTFSHPGTSRKLTHGAYAAAVNDQMLLSGIQQAEISRNSIDSILLNKHREFLSSNYFLLVNSASKRGVFVINPGLKAIQQDALGVDVRIDTKGVPDITLNADRNEAERKAKATAARPQLAGPEVARATLKLASDFATDASGANKVAGLTQPASGTAIVAWAVDGTSLIAADTLVIPAAEKLLVRALLPESLTPGQAFSIPVCVTNRGSEPTAGLSAECTLHGVTRKLPLAALAPGARSVTWLEELKAPAQPGTTEVSIAVGGVTWRGNLSTRDLTVPVILPAGGLFAQGERTLTLPVADGVTGFRLVKALDVAAFAGASLNPKGEANDASEPQNAASALLQVLAALTNAQDPATKTALQSRLATLTAELAVTEHEGGGWSWENIEISPGLLTTAFTWRALLEAKAAGVVVSDMLLKRTAAFVAGRYGGIGTTDFERKAVVLQAMAAAGKADFSLLNPLYRVRESLTPVALVRLCAAFIHAGRDDEAKDLLALVLKTGTVGKTPDGDDTLYWPGSKTVAGLNAPEEATAAALWCTAKLSPAAPEARRIATWLLTSQASTPGGATRCRGQVMQALAEYAKSLPRTAAADTVEVLADGKPITAGPGDLLPLPADGKLTVRVTGTAPAVVIAAVVRATPPDDPKTWEYPTIASRTYLHDNYMLGEARLGSASTSPVTQAASGQLLRVVVKVANHPDETWQAHGNFLQLEEEIPAGCLFVEGSLKCNAQGIERVGNRLRLRYGPGTMGHVSYDVIALMPGTWTAQAAVLADPYDPARCRRSTSNTLTILPPGQPAAEAYVMNRAEHLEAARLLFNQNQGAECLTHLEALVGGKLTQDEERDTARMRLWILADREDADARTMIGAFELLTERHPRLVIPFEKLLRVGAAYRRLGEFERAATVFRAALDGAFLADSGLSVALEDAGDFTGGVNLQEQLWRQYPDSEDVIGSLSGLAQSLSTKAPEAEKLAVRRGQQKLEKNALLTRSRDLLERFITLYPADAQADDAAFSLVNVFFSLKDYPGMVRAATAGAERHSTGPFADSFKYMAALGYFWQGAFDQALAAAAPVANGEGKDRDYARYVTAQVYHAQGRPAEAIAWYQKVRTVYEDAAQAIALFEEKRVSLPEVTIFKPGDEVKLTLDYRNLTEGAVQLYKVDLLKLYLREKSLSNITRVNLAGIAPQAGEAFALGDGKDYAVKQKVLHLPVTAEGAYLAIVRGDNLFTSGLVLISPLKLEVKESPEGSVRATVTDAATGKALADAEVKALGSDSQEVQSGTTDPRGVFEVGGIEGTSTVIVKQGDNRYAFHRGTLVLQPNEPPQLPQQNVPSAVSPATPKSAPAKRNVLEKGEYLKNIEESNQAVQKSQLQNWETKRRANSKGVEASDVMKK
ncbi:MAG: tetratricopeptide repeat protein [Verrucomicrobia bacterium]|nr:tetratricopeptide repeat protein [Verrucomicrobiota bacterium]